MKSALCRKYRPSSSVLWPTHGPGPADRSPHAITGYDEASVISPYAIEHDLTLKEAALANGVR